MKKMIILPCIVFIVCLSCEVKGNDPNATPAIFCKDETSFCYDLFCNEDKDCKLTNFVRDAKNLNECYCLEAIGCEDPDFVLNQKTIENRSKNYIFNCKNPEQRKKSEPGKIPLGPLPYIDANGNGCSDPGQSSAVCGKSFKRQAVCRSNQCEVKDVGWSSSEGF